MCSHKRRIQNISDGIFILSHGSCPKGWISKIFLPNFVCVLTNEGYKTYQEEFFILSPDRIDMDEYKCIALKGDL